MDELSIQCRHFYANIEKKKDVLKRFKIYSRYIRKGK